MYTIQVRFYVVFWFQIYQDGQYLDSMWDLLNMHHRQYAGRPFHAQQPMIQGFLK